MKKTFLIIIIIFLMPVKSFPQAFNIPPKWMPVGAGVAFSGKKYLFTADLSLVYLVNNFGFGGYSDFQKGIKVTNYSAGPEFFFSVKSGLSLPVIIGFDGGFSQSRDKGKTYTGFSVRGFTTIGPAVPFFRYSSRSGKSNKEFGLLVKVPIPIK